MNLKRKIGIKLSNSAASVLLNKVNLIFFHWKARAHIVHFGKDDPSNQYLCIRPMDNTQGLLSTYFYVLNNVKWAIEHNYTPYVDFDSNDCQYYTGRDIHGSTNAWEYYFTQPSKVEKQDLLNKKNVLLSGWTFRKKFKINQIPKTVEALRSLEVKEISQQIRINENVHRVVNEKKTLFKGSVLGVFMRGTDYVKLKPKGHAVQPNLDQMIDKIEEFLKKYKIDKIFVVTEDDQYYTTLKNKYGDMVFCSDNYFIKGYNADGYIQSSFDNDPYERGLNYLVRVLLLNECDYLISGITNGSLVSCCLNDKEYKDEYWFQLGDY